MIVVTLGGKADSGSGLEMGCPRMGKENLLSVCVLPVVLVLQQMPLWPWVHQHCVWHGWSELYYKGVEGPRRL